MAKHKVKLVGLGYQARVGKDTIARHLGWRRIAFADKVKEVANVLFPGHDAFDDDFKLALMYNGLFGRQNLQRIGTSLRESLGTNVWIHAANLRGYVQLGPVVVTDIRHENEFAAIKALGGVCVRIVRETGLCDNHITEQAGASLPWDYTYENDRPEKPVIIANQISSLFPA